MNIAARVGRLEAMTSIDDPIGVRRCRSAVDRCGALADLARRIRDRLVRDGHPRASPFAGISAHLHAAAAAGELAATVAIDQLRSRCHQLQAQGGGGSCI